MVHLYLRSDKAHFNFIANILLMISDYKKNSDMF